MIKKIIFNLFCISFIFSSIGYCGRAGLQSGVDAKVTVANTSTQVVSADTGREYLVIVNDSDEAVYISFDGSAAVMNQGIRLNAYGGSSTWNYPVIPYTAVFAICASGSKNITVHTGE